MVDLLTPPTRDGVPTGGPSGSGGAGDPTGHDRFARGNARWVQTFVLWIALVASVGSLQPLFQGLSWWWISALVSAIVLAASALARAAHWPTLVAWIAGLVVAAVACTVVVSGGTAVAGLVPTAATADRVQLLLQQAQSAIVGDQAPIPVSAAIFSLVVVSVAAGALFLDLIARVCRLPALTGALFAIIVAVPSFVPDISPAWGWVVVTVAAFVALLIVSTGRRPSRAGVGVGVVVLLVAGVVTSLLPVAGVSPITGVGSGSGLATGVNPVVNLGDNLRRGAAVQVLTYTTTSTTGDYLKLADISDFTGRSWSPDSVTLKSADRVSSLPAAPGISKSTRRDKVTTHVSIDVLRSPYLPIPVPATKVTGIDDKWEYVDSSGVTIRSSTEGSQGLDYTVTSAPVDPTRKQIVASLALPTPALKPYLATTGVPSSITALAKKVTAGTRNKFDAAVALQDYFRNGTFTYSEDTPVEQGYDGTGLEEVEKFLQVKSGYCVHFASAMAVMARTLGIPSRMAVGFLPGVQESSDASSPWQVTSNDLHTWPELYFQGLGWVPFEPTVGQGTTSAYIQQTGTDQTATPSSSSAPTTTTAPTVQPTASATNVPTITPTATSSSAVAAPATRSSGDRAVVLVVLIVLLLALLSTPAWMRLSRRRRRLRRPPPDSALFAWREVVDSARDLGLGLDPSATPQQIAAVIDGRLSASTRVGAGVGRAALAPLLAAVEEERFGGSDSRGSVHDDARTVISGLRAASPLGRRAIAVVAPVSLFAEQRARTAE